MEALKKYIFLTILFLSIALSHKSYSQYFLHSNETANLGLSFLKESINANSGESFFNTIFIKNNGTRTEFFTLNISVPQSWKVLGQEQQDLVLDPGDSLIIPLRVSTHAKAKGDIGYSVIASLTDSRGNTIKNEYCFIKIASKADLRVSVPIGTNYFDQKTWLSGFPVNISNNGNKEELINLIFDLEKGIGLGDSFLENFSLDIMVPPYTDTTLYYTVRLKPDMLEGKESFRLHLVAETPGKRFSQSVWFRTLNAQYNNYIPPTQKTLLVDFSAQGLLSQGRIPNYILYLQGKTLLKNNNDIYYQYRNLSSNSTEALYKYNFMHIGANINKWNFEVGDSYMNHEASLYGRGITVGYTGNKFNIQSIANSDPKTDIKNAGLFGGISFGKSSLNLGVSVHDNQRAEVQALLASIEPKINIRKHNLSLLMAANPVKQDRDGQTDHLEYSSEIRYSSSFKKLRNIVKLRYATPNYYGNYKGRLFGYLSSQYLINQTNRLSLHTTLNNNTRPIISSGQTLYNNENSSTIAKLFHTWDITPKANFFYGPTFERFQKNQIQNNAALANDFISNTVGLQAGSRFRFDDPYTSFTPKITVGNVNIIDFPRLYGNNPGLYTTNTNYFIYYLDVNYRSRYWNFIASYEAGPRNVYSQFNYFYLGRSTRTLRVMPSVDMFLYKKIMHLEAGITYNNDMVLKNSFINTSALFTWYLPQYWSAYANAFYTITNRTTSSGTDSYQSLYLEAGIRKELNLKHPRVSYHTLSLTLFKDFNGNYEKESNEPGIPQVIVSLTREINLKEEYIPGNVGNIELMSNYLGEVTFTDIPNGIYKVEFTPIGKEVGTFTKSVEELTINLQEDQHLYFPFVEKNKVFGKIILNRSRLSGIGKIDVSNVRLTVTDSHGRSFSTLTDKNGEFVLFAPITDEYIVTINNLFYEDFDLRQNNFVVQFNGYKQFEVNFIFDEKVRRINFASTDAERAMGLQQIRRTTISGTVKDANTQQPVRAKVNLVNTRTNSVFTSTSSSATSGDYNLTFVAGDNYLLEVIADDYWYLSENLMLQQITTFMNITRDVLLKPVTVGSSIDLNIRFAANDSYLAPESVAELNRLLRQLKDNQTVRIEIQGHCDNLEALQKPNVALDRANAVGKYLIENGFSNFALKSMGNTTPVSFEETEEGRGINRRISVVVLSK